MNSTDRVWYRLLKFLFGCGFFIVAAGSAWWVFATNETVLIPDVQITCHYGNGTTFYASHDKGISIKDYDPNKTVPDTMNAKIVQDCGITQADINQNAAAYAETMATIHTENLTEEQQACSSSDPLSHAACQAFKQGVVPNGEAPNPYPYGIVPTKITVNNSSFALTYAALDIVIVACVFEGIRRAFYYIATGKIRLPK